MLTVQHALGWVLVTNLAVIFAVDALALQMGRSDLTVSYWVWQIGQSHPVLYLLLGVAIGHLFLPLVIGR